jgi:hypothetical protein
VKTWRLKAFFCGTLRVDLLHRRQIVRGHRFHVAVRTTTVVESEGL